ncbi:MAG: helix-turn-helix transcriptional regulator [Rhodocyclaceae bacterium]|nr:helix-turn-helix transcriptional regulator [Rhodocyclaceae bacterium]
MDNEQFSARLLAERKRLKQNQAEFGALGGVSRLAQLNYEHGDRAPSAEYLLKLGDAGVDVVYLLTGQRLEINALDWDIVERAFKLVFRMVEDEPEMRFSSDHLFDLFKTIWTSMMRDTYGETNFSQEQRALPPAGRTVEGV